MINVFLRGTCTKKKKKRLHQCENVTPQTTNSIWMWLSCNCCTKDNFWTCVYFLHHNFKNGSLHTITGDEMVRWSFFSFTLTCCESRISYGLNGPYYCRPVHCSQKLWPGGSYWVAQKTLLLWTWWVWIVPASLVAWFLWQVQQHLSLAWPTFALNFLQAEVNTLARVKKNCVSLAEGSKVIEMTTLCCITEIRSFKLQTKAF